MSARERNLGGHVGARSHARALVATLPARAPSHEWFTDPTHVPDVVWFTLDCAFTHSN